ncbi:hypothetical protein H4S14_003750 [Agrobacterium vitis]|nr:hypothetical protein [Agrobacterium vitis]MBE1439981.1 hypothetical protein [Agrobacterium vitis]
MNAFRFRQRQAEPDVDLLPPEHRPRPRPRNGFALADDVADAAFVTVNDPVGEMQNRLQAELNGSAAGKPALIFALVRRRLAGPLRRLDAVLDRLSERSFTTLVSTMVLVVFVLAGGFTLFGSHGPAPLIGPALDITHVSLTPQDADGMHVLVVNAIIENRANTTQDLPPVRADLYANGRLIASTLIAPPAAEIGVGHSRGISARLRHPGGKTPQLKLSFDRTDASHS